MGNRAVVVNSIVENLFLALPMLHKKLIRVDLENVVEHLSLPHFIIMRVLAHADSLPVSRIADRLYITRPQMTSLIDRLVELGMVERSEDNKDRRIINIHLTDRGREALKACENLIKDNTRKKLSNLEDAELEKLSDALKTITEIGSKLE
jgi:DNA-binding MarR family transcriptional regulator